MKPQDFNGLVELAMKRPGLAAMRPVVEKEILHYDIFQALDTAGLLRGLVFQGGTSLRLCRGSQRFSEDLDFAGGKDFTASKMTRIKDCLEAHIGQRYGLTVKVIEKLHREIDNVKVDKWQVNVETAPAARSMPKQKIRIEVANIPAYTGELVPIRANYDFLPDYDSILVVAKSMAEVMANKVLAFPAALAKRIRYRDIWDLAWLDQQNAVLDPDMVVKKIADYGVTGYEDLLDNAIAQLPAIVRSKPFKDQMARFVDAELFNKRFGDERFLDYLSSTAGRMFTAMKAYLNSPNNLASMEFRI